MPRNGRVVVVIVLAIAFALGGLGSWWLVRARPEPGAFLDALALPDGGAVVIREERGTEHAFIEVHDRDRLLWRGLVPHYAGRPGTMAVAVSPAVLTVRVARGGHPHLFAFDTRTGSKITSFDLMVDEPPDAAAYTLPSIATVGAGDRSVEVLARPGGGARLVLVELRERRLAWKVDVAAPPDEVWVTDTAVVARTGSARAAWHVVTGTPIEAPSTPPPSREVSWPVPPDAVPARAYHRGGDRTWVVRRSVITVLDASLAPVKTLTN